MLIPSSGLLVGTCLLVLCLWLPSIEAGLTSRLLGRRNRDTSHVFTRLPQHDGVPGPRVTQHAKVFQALRDDVTGVYPLDHLRRRRRRLHQLRDRQLEQMDAPTWQALWMQHVNHQIHTQMARARQEKTSGSQEPHPKKNASEERSLQADECDPFDFLCAFCQGLEESLGVNAEVEVTCEGELFGNNNVTAAIRTCLYVSASRFGPYDASLYDPTTDICVRGFQYTSSMDGIDSSRIESVVLQADGETAETTLLVEQVVAPCNATDPFSDTCTECTGAFLNGQECDFCTICTDPDDPFTVTLGFSCASIDPSIDFPCEEGVSIGPLFLLQEDERFCAWEQVSTGSCAFDAYCSTLIAFTTGDGDFDSVACVTTGDPSSDWSVSLSLGEELCYYRALQNEADYNATLFDPTTDVCYKVETVLVGQGPTLVTEERGVATITRPVEAVLTESYQAINCPDDYETDDDIFQPSYCSEECPSAYVIDGMDCTSGCETCVYTDFFGDNVTDTLATCSNVDPSLVEPCNWELEGEYLAVISGYLYQRSLLETSKPTMAPIEPMEEPTTSSPTSAPTSTPVDDPAPTSASARWLAMLGIPIGATMMLLAMSVSW